jgi:hypothetical protein
MSNPLHPSVNVCAMCGALVGDELTHMAFHMGTEAAAEGCMSAINKITDSVAKMGKDLANDTNLINGCWAEVTRIRDLQQVDDERILDLEGAQLDLEDR